MGLFDRVEVDEFNAFRTEVKSKLEELAEEIKRKTTDSEQIARAASDNALAIEKNMRETESVVAAVLRSLESYKKEVEGEVKVIQSERARVATSNEDLLKSVEATKAIYTQILEEKRIVDAAASDISAKIEQIDGILSESKRLPEDVENTKKLLDEAKGVNDAIQNLLTHSMKRKGEIDELHKEIYGHDVRSGEGQSEHVDGLRDDLQNSYESVVAETLKLEIKIQELIDSISEKHCAHLDAQKADFDTLIAISKSRITAVNEQLDGLLPGAMAAGLSAAYEKKEG